MTISAVNITTNIYRVPDVHLILTSKMDERPRSCTGIIIVIADAQLICSEWNPK